MIQDSTDATMSPAMTSCTSRLASKIKCVSDSSLFMRCSQKTKPAARAA